MTDTALKTSVRLDDKYTQSSGQVYLNGVQALVRLPLMQRQLDAQQGLNTAGFISGYRGSPLAPYDLALWQARDFLEKEHIKFTPGLNEDLAATAVWGTQSLDIYPRLKYDGVFGIWYAKNPGVDRSGDVLKHANFSGTLANGGVLAIAGDDPAAMSSSMPNQCEHGFISYGMPVLFPAGIQEFLDFGLAGIAMSRYSGCWVAFKTVSETIEGSGTVEINPERFQFRLPDDFEKPENWRGEFYERIAGEDFLIRQRIPAAQAFARANGIDKIMWKQAGNRLGIVASGKSYLDVRQALDDLGIDEARAHELGLCLYKIGMVWPLDPVRLAEFTDGLAELFFVEELRAVTEPQAKESLFGRQDAPLITGKQDSDGELIPLTGVVTPAAIARALVKRLDQYGLVDAPLRTRLEDIAQREQSTNVTSTDTVRMPYYCSGCPHSSGTKVPEGSVAHAGIGCHFMAVWMNRRTETWTAMGGEGADWIGQAPFTETNHIFVNLGDGTYQHSGLLAIRAAVAAGVTVTYKILYNDATAMTGGQPVEGGVTVEQIVHQVHAEGVARVVVAGDEPDKYPLSTQWPAGVTFHHRREMDSLQRSLRQTPGVTVLVFDQTCAAEKRRRRKRGTYPDPAKRAFINHRVCEGCGDCSVQSNCVSVQPRQTGFGLKRRIDQSACNKDFSCVEGFCPSFVTVHGGGLKKAQTASIANMASAPGADNPFGDLPAPALPAQDKAYNILVTGVGGTGVITVGALLGMAAHIEQKASSVLDMTGLAQKNGAVVSHIRIAPQPSQIHAARIGTGNADLLLGCDLVVAANHDALSKVDPGRTQAIVNTFELPTSSFVTDNTQLVDGAKLSGLVRDAVGDNRTEFVDATGIATALMGDSIATNLFMLGYAYQRGGIPLSDGALEDAIRLNGVAVDSSLETFRWGRLAAHDLGAVTRRLGKSGQGMPADTEAPESLQEKIDRLSAELTAYQNEAYAGRFRKLAEVALRAEPAGREQFTDKVAEVFFRLMAYKDEYEVARLYSDPAFLNELKTTFDGDYKLKVHLAPPLLSAIDPDTGRPAKRAFGPWVLNVMQVLHRFKALRGTKLDPFGYTAERKAERALIEDYDRLIRTISARLSPENYDIAIAVAAASGEIRGYGPVKEASMETAKAEEARLLQIFENPEAAARQAAE